MRVIADGIARAYNVDVEVDYTREFVPLINDAALAGEALATARALFGDDQVVVSDRPITASEDFARFLTRVPGCFVFIGNGVESPSLHNPKFDFNDACLSRGVDFFTALARRRLPRAIPARA